MAKVLNKTNRSLQVERWTLFAGGTKCIDQNGNIREELPDTVAYGPVVKHLLDLNLVSLGGVPRKYNKAVSFTGAVKQIEVNPPMQHMNPGPSKSQRKKLRGEQRG